MNDADSGTAGGRRARGFEENERPTSPGQLPRTKTSRWRSVASAALQRGFGRLSDEDVDQRNERQGAPSTSDETGEDAIDIEVEVSAFDPVAADASTEPAAAVVAPAVEAGVPQPGRPTRHRGPNGTMRIRLREDLGPTGTMVIRRRTDWRPGRRAWVKVLGFATACALAIVVGYRGDRSAGQAAAAAPLAPSSAPVAPAAPPPVQPSDLADVAPAVAAPAASTPRRASPHKGARSKSNVF